MEKELFNGRLTVVKALVGSHNYNLNTKSSDQDYKYFVAPTFDDLYSGKMFSTSSQSDSMDYDCHDIRQLSNLLWKANINFVEVLFSRDLFFHPGLSWLFDHKNALSSMNLPYLYKATMGMHFQKMNHLFDGTAKTKPLVQAYGYDTKQATHAYRYLKVLERLSYDMPMQEAIYFGGLDRYNLLTIKEGLVPLERFQGMVADWFAIHDERVKTWFSDKVSDEALKEEMDEVVKSFIRIGL